MIYLKIVTFLPAPLFNMNNPPKGKGAGIERSLDVAAWRKSANINALASVRQQRLKLPFPPSSVQITLGVPDRRKRDPHNYEQTCKPIVDGLVSAGLWPDDDPTWVQMLPVKLDYALKGWYQVEIFPMVTT